MNKNTGLIVVGAALAVKAVTAAATIRHIRKDGKNERSKIQAEMLKDLEAIHVAKGIVLERVAQGKYRSHEEALNDVRFEAIINRQE